jgi:integrase
VGYPNRGSYRGAAPLQDRGGQSAHSRKLADRYIRDVLPTKGKSTQPSQRKQLEWWKVEIGTFVLVDCTPALIAEARDKLLVRQSSGSTANRYLAVLSHAFTVVWREWGWLDANPVYSVTKAEEPRGRVRFLSDEERDRLLASCRKSTSFSWLYPLVVLALSTGM